MGGNFTRAIAHYLRVEKRVRSVSKRQRAAVGQQLALALPDAAGLTFSNIKQIPEMLRRTA
jgi:hypothetical protein